MATFSAMNFRKPVCVGDVVSVYANIARVGERQLRCISKPGCGGAGRASQ
jgi:acyl-CoA hydrolase